MTRETLIKTINDFIFNGKDPFIISAEIADFILEKFKPKVDNTLTRLTAETEQWIDDWVNLFPEGVKGGTKLVRSDRKVCLTKMAKFRQEYPQYTVKQIYQATNQYLKERAKEGWAYIMPAVNFITHRDKGSELGARCRSLSLLKVLDDDSEIIVKSEPELNYFL